MRVLHVLASNKYSGAENVVCQIIDAFKNEVEMAYCSLDGEIRNTLTEKQVQFCPMSKFSLKELKRVVNEFKPDIIHAHDLKAITLVSLLNKKIKKVGHVHVNDKEKMSKISLKSVVLKLISSKFSHLFWVSNSCLDEYKFKKSLQHKSSVLYNIINEEKLIDLANKDKNNYDYDIIYLGRLSYQKHPQRLIEIAKALKEKQPNFKMAIIGSGDMEEEIKQLIVSYGLENNVFCLGFMRNAYKLLNQAKLMLMTSRFEGTPMVALEALSLGVPIVTTKTDGMMDLITHSENGYLYDDNQEAVEFISNLISNNDLQKNLSENSSKFSKRYNDIEQYKQKLKKIYKE
ncbi:MAG: glycosyltransferase [Clostridia bacterium]|nr:glycosyltransferase [Clostridia bacterium]